MIYLDHAATTPVLPEAAQAAIDAINNDFGNPSSLHALGLRANDIINNARVQVARAVGCDPGNVIFTSGGTESNAIAVNSALRKPGRIITTALEHDSMNKTLNEYKSRGFDVVVIPPTRNGRVRMDDYLSHITPDTVLACCTAVCTLNGALPDVDAIFTAVKQIAPNAWLHCDAVHAPGKIPLPKLSYTLSLSGHKLGATKGVGALITRHNKKIHPLWNGGGHENGLRAGTQNVSGIAAMGVAIQHAVRDGTSRFYELKQYALDKFATISNLHIIPPHDAPHIIAFALPPLPGEVWVRKLSDKGIYLSAGTACGKGKQQQLLIDMKLPHEVVTSALRLSFGYDTIREDIDGLIEAIKELR